MARVERYVVGLTERSADRVQLRERVREPSEISKVLEGGVATAVAVADERTAVDRREDHVVAADVNRPLAVSRLEVELGRRLRHVLGHELRVEPDEPPIDPLACGAEEFECLVAVELNPDLRHEAPPAAVEDSHRLVREDLVPWHRVDEHVASVGRGPPASMHSTASMPGSLGCRDACDRIP